MPTAEEFKLELHRMMLEGVRAGKETIDITAGELHRRVGAYPDLNRNRMPVCCDVMMAAIAPGSGDRILEQPPSGQGQPDNPLRSSPTRLMRFLGKVEGRPCSPKTAWAERKKEMLEWLRHWVGSLNAISLTAVATVVYGVATFLLWWENRQDRIQRDKQFQEERANRRLGDLYSSFYDAWGYWLGHKYRSGDSMVDASQSGRGGECCTGELGQGYGPTSLH